MSNYFRRKEIERGKIEERQCGRNTVTNTYAARDVISLPSKP